jgi:hypothetical protein
MYTKSAFGKYALRASFLLLCVGAEFSNIERRIPNPTLYVFHAPVFCHLGRSMRCPQAASIDIRTSMYPVLAVLAEICRRIKSNPLGKLSCDVTRCLVVGNAFFAPGHELRRAAFHDLPDVGPKLMEKVNACVTANRRPQSFESRRAGARPIRTISSGDRNRSQHAKEIRRI